MAKERRLGRGLEALLGRPLDEAESGGGSAGERILQLNVYEIDRNPYQPRLTFDETEIETLSESLDDHGMLQPLVVRRDGNRYQLVSGERRLRAATYAGWETVPARIRDANEREMAELAIVENVQRKDLDPLEKAASFQKYLETYGCTQEELAGRVKVDRSTIANLIRLLELPEQVQDALRSRKITMGHARALLPLGDEREQIAFCRRIQEESLSVRATEADVKEMIRQADGEPLSVVDRDGKARRSAPTRSQHVASLEQELRLALGTKIDIRQTARGRGRIIVHFTGPDEFERLRAQLTDPGDAERYAG